MCGSSSPVEERVSRHPQALANIRCQTLSLSLTHPLTFLTRFLWTSVFIHFVRRMSASLTPGTCAHGTNTVEGKLKGFDTLVNLVLDECVEYMRGDVCVREVGNARECVRALSCLWISADRRWQCGTDLPLHNFHIHRTCRYR